MNQQPRYATVRKYATREMLSGNFQHAVFGARIRTDSSRFELELAKTPEEIVYFLDDNSYSKFVEMILNEFPVDEICAVHR